MALVVEVARDLGLNGMIIRSYATCGRHWASNRVVVIVFTETTLVRDNWFSQLYLPAVRARGSRASQTAT